MRCCGSLGILMDWDWTEKWLPLPTVLCVIIIGSHRKHLLLMLKEFVWVTAVTLTSCCVFISLFVRWSHMKVSLHLISEGSPSFPRCRTRSRKRKSLFLSSQVPSLQFPHFTTQGRCCYTRDKVPRETLWEYLGLCAKILAHFILRSKLRRHGAIWELRGRLSGNLFMFFFLFLLG